MSQYTVFTSDVHLRNTISGREELFIAFLDWVAEKADALYLVGDIFDAWIGDDDMKEANPVIIPAFKKCAQKIPVYYTLGNHDPLVPLSFFTKTGIQKLPEIKILQLYGHDVLLTHGDIFCTKVHFKILRRIYNHPFFQKAFLLLPLAVRRTIVQILMSRPHRPLSKIADLNTNVFSSAMRKHDTPQLIHGHTHRPQIKDLQLKIDNSNAEQISLGCWTEQKGCYLKYYSDGKRELCYFKNDYV
jgi:UDP-2,3-diacylglucosamine hydrolase